MADYMIQNYLMSFKANFESKILVKAVDVYQLAVQLQKQTSVYKLLYYWLFSQNG